MALKSSFYGVWVHIMAALGSGPSADDEAIMSTTTGSKMGNIIDDNVVKELGMVEKMTNGRGTQYTIP